MATVSICSCGVHFRRVKDDIGGDTKVLSIRGGSVVIFVWQHPGKHFFIFDLRRYRLLQRIYHHSLVRWQSAKVGQVYPPISSPSNGPFFWELRGKLVIPLQMRNRPTPGKKGTSAAVSLQFRKSMVDDSSHLMVNDSAAAAFAPYRMIFN